MGETVAARLARCSNRPGGFDYMRLILSTGVVVSHIVNVSYGQADVTRVWDGPLRPLLAGLLPMFFGLSGFLVAGSLDRCKTMISFLGLRVIRLVPALAVDTLIAALLIGPIFTTHTLHDYFADPVFRIYFLNMVGDVHTQLPGVFIDNPSTGVVNGQLWTLPYELLCYITLTGFALLGLTRSRWVFLAAAIAVMIGAAVILPVHVQGAHHGIDGRAALVQCFLFGVAAYLFRDRLVLSHLAGVAAAVIAAIMVTVPRADFFVAPVMVYLTVYLGTLNPYRIRLVRSGDYSYGIFLYGYPIQQASVALFGPLPWYVSFVPAFAAICALAAFSWWCVEAPALRLRPYLYRFEATLTGWALAVPGAHLLVQPATGPRLRRPPARETV